MCATHILEGRGTQNQNQDQQRVPILNLVLGHKIGRLVDSEREREREREREHLLRFWTRRM